MVQSNLESAGSGEKLQVIAFKIGKEELAFDINSVREIIKFTEITRVPNSPDFVEGVINLRGQIKTIFNLKKKLDIALNKVDQDSKIIIVDAGQETYGIIVDSVIGVVNLEKGAISDPSLILDGKKTDYIRGIGRKDDSLILILEPLMLFSLEEKSIS